MLYVSLTLPTPREKLTTSATATTCMEVMRPILRFSLSSILHDFELHVQSGGGAAASGMTSEGGTDQGVNGTEDPFGLCQRPLDPSTSWRHLASAGVRGAHRPAHRGQAVDRKSESRNLGALGNVEKARANLTRHYRQIGC